MRANVVVNGIFCCLPRVSAETKTELTAINFVLMRVQLVGGSVQQCSNDVLFGRGHHVGQQEVDVGTWVIWGRTGEHRLRIFVLCVLHKHHVSHLHWPITPLIYKFVIVLFITKVKVMAARLH